MNERDSLLKRLAGMRLVYRRHAELKMFERGITEQDVEACLAQPVVIEDYPEAPYGPCLLLLGHSGSRPLHVVLGIDSDHNIAYVITVYEPDLKRWEAGYTVRRR